MSRDYHGFGIHSPLINYVVHRLPICVSLIHPDLEVSCIPNMSLIQGGEYFQQLLAFFYPHREHAHKSQFMSMWKPVMNYITGVLMILKVKVMDEILSMWIGKKT